MRRGRRAIKRKNADCDWDSFGAATYSETNYAGPHAADIWLAARLAEFYRGLPCRINIVDVGTGPSLLTLLAAVGRGNSVVALDISASNMAWLADAIATYETLPGHWQMFWNALCSAAPEIYQGVDPIAALRSLVELRQASVFDLPERSWDAATMFFVAESITEDLGEFQRACRTFARGVMPGGALAAAFMDGSAGYTVDGASFPAVDVSIGEIAKAFASDVEEISIVRVPEGDCPIRTGYDGMLFMTATVRLKERQE